MEKEGSNKEMDFETFAKRVQEHELDRGTFSSAAHHSNGCGHDWEALQKKATEEENLPGIEK